MKKLLALIMCVALLATTGVIFASAAPVTDNFTPAGDYEITWDPEVADKIELDGDISDWQAAGYTPYQITTDNLISWNGTVDANFEINAFYVSDADFLYVAFWIVDDDFIPSTDLGDYHDGDAFQIAIDFNRELQKILDGEDASILDNPKNIFYSFDCVVDGEFVFYRNEKLVEGTENLAGSEDIMGAGAATEGGWCAEFALSWKMLYEDFAYKSYIDEYSAILDKNNDLQLGITLCYLDMGENGMTSAAGTFKQDATFTPADNGLSLTLKWAEGVTINCDGILTPAEGEEYVTTDAEDTVVTDPTEETTAEETTAEETTAEETTAEETTAEETTTAEAKTEAPKAEKKGCGSVVATGAAVAVLAAAAAAVALKKKD